MNKSNDHYDEYMAYLNRLKAIAEQKEQWEQQQQQLVDKTIGSTADSLAQSWIDAFEKGEEATWDFAKNFEDVMRKAIVNGLRFGNIGSDRSYIQEIPGKGFRLPVR